MSYSLQISIMFKNLSRASFGSTVELVGVIRLIRVPLDKYRLVGLTYQLYQPVPKLVRNG